MGPPWWGIASLVISGMLALVFIVGAFFETRRSLRKWKKDHSRVRKSQ
ncbi:MAG: hypothetical protein K6T30_04645 [Alicyclobacillus sp.]|nr:hypothetical protein [Alicyclobacillus sp.]